MSKREKIIIPGEGLLPIIMAYMGRLRPGRGSLLGLQVYTASSPGCSGGGAGKGRRACNLEFEFHLQFRCGSPSTELSYFRQSAPSSNERECKQT